MSRTAGRASLRSIRQVTHYKRWRTCGGDPSTPSMTRWPRSNALRGGPAGDCVQMKNLVGVTEQGQSARPRRGSNRLRASPPYAALERRAIRKVDQRCFSRSLDLIGDRKPRKRFINMAPCHRSRLPLLPLPDDVARRVYGERQLHVMVYVRAVRGLGLIDRQCRWNGPGNDHDEPTIARVVLFRSAAIGPDSGLFREKGQAFRVPTAGSPPSSRHAGTQQ